MSGRSLKIAVVSLSLAVALATSAAGAAALPSGLFGSGPEFALRAPGGYRLSVSRGEHHEVSLSIRRGSATTTYSAPGRATVRRVDARFGRFGRIAVSFEPSGRTRRIPPLIGCKGKPALSHRGTFRGTIRFHGEGGYTTVEADSARGTVTTNPARHCRGKGATPGPKPGPPEEGTDGPVFLFAGCGDTSFFAVGGHSTSAPAPVFPDEFEFTGIGGGSKERVGSVSISRYALLFGAPRSAFGYDEAMKTATVKPPPPFHGKASLSTDAAGGHHWEGNLSASLIGKDVTLAGPDFGAGLFPFSSIPSHPPSGRGASCARHS